MITLRDWNTSISSWGLEDTDQVDEQFMGEGGSSMVGSSMVAVLGRLAPRADQDL